MTRNKELEAVLEPKEGEEVVLYEVLDKDIKPPSAKTRSHRKDSQSEQCDEVSPVIVNDLIGAYFQITASCLINAPSTLLTLGRARKFIPPPWYKGWGGGEFFPKGKDVILTSYRVPVSHSTQELKSYHFLTGTDN